MPATLTKKTPVAVRFSESFLLLKENRFAHTATESLRQNTSTFRKPLVFLYGPSGVGKTHLTKQYLRESTRRKKKIEASHLTAAEFAAQLAEASDSSSIAEFQQRFRSLDILICEDLQSLEKRPQSQLQLLLILDEIVASGGKVVVTSNKSPGQLNSFSQKLINRFHGGACVLISLPGKSSRQSLIEHFASSQQIPLSSNVIHYLAEKLPVTPRELLATVSQLDITAQLQNRRVDLEFTRLFLESQTTKPALTVTKITQAVARHFDVTVADLRSLSRSRCLVLPRHYAMYLSRKLTKQPFSQIGKFFGQRSHSTIVHACNRLEKQLPDNADSRQNLTELLQKLKVTEANFCS